MWEKEKCDIFHSNTSASQKKKKKKKKRMARMNVEEKLQNNKITLKNNTRKYF